MSKSLFDPRVLIAAIAEVAKVRGLSQVAAAAGIGSDNIATALSWEIAPSFEMIRAVLRDWASSWRSSRRRPLP